MFPDRVPAIVAESQARLNTAAGFENLDALCKKMTDDLRDISSDRHMLVRYVERPIDRGALEEPSEKEIEEERLEARLDGGGVTPDIEIPSDRAYSMALEAVIDRLKDEEGPKADIRKKAQAALAELESPS